MNDNLIQDVSDTALWVAVYRAQESERADAVFKDPWAAILAGERGKKIAASMEHQRIMAWVMTVRTVAIDQLVFAAIREGVDTILNLGAGLDTRPYRLQLPANLRWIEVDFPKMISYKNDTLKNESPQCRLERISLDLSDDRASADFFNKVGSESKKVLVITEGVLPYLTNEQVDQLSAQLRAIPSFQFWIQDYRNGGYGAVWRKNLRQKLHMAPFRFRVEDWLHYFAVRGWNEFKVKYAIDVGREIGRPFPIHFLLMWLVGLLPRKRLDRFRTSTGYVLLKKS